MYFVIWKYARAWVISVSFSTRIENLFFLFIETSSNVIRNFDERVRKNILEEFFNFFISPNFILSFNTPSAELYGSASYSNMNAITRSCKQKQQITNHQFIVLQEIFSWLMLLIMTHGDYGLTEINVWWRISKCIAFWLTWKTPTWLSSKKITNGWPREQKFSKTFPPTIV